MVIVALMIAWAAYEVMQDAIHPLMGEKPPEDLKKHLHSISTKALGFDPEIHHIHLHRYGEHVELTFHLNLPPEISLSEAHHHVEKVEQAIEDELQMTATIHADPSGMPEMD